MIMIKMWDGEIWYIKMVKIFSLNVIVCNLISRVIKRGYIWFKCK